MFTVLTISITFSAWDGDLRRGSSVLSQIVAALSVHVVYLLANLIIAFSSYSSRGSCVRNFLKADEIPRSGNFVKIVSALTCSPTDSQNVLMELL